MDNTNNRFEAKAQTSSSPPPLNSQILSRVVGYLQSLSGTAGIVSIVLLSGEATLPHDYKPSTIIGGFHGRLEAADAAAKMATVPEFTRKNAEASSQPPAIAAMEAEAFRQQQQVLAGALQSESVIANTADAACAGAKLVSPGDPDWGWLGTLLKSGCGVGDEVRGDMMTTLRRGGQDNSVLIQRPRAGN